MSVRQRAEEFWAELGCPPMKVRSSNPWYMLPNADRANAELYDRYQELRSRKDAMKAEWKRRKNKWMWDNWAMYNELKSDYRKFYFQARQQAASILSTVKIPRTMYEHSLETKTRAIFNSKYSAFLSRYARFMSGEPKKPIEYYDLKKQIRQIETSAPEIFH